MPNIDIRISAKVFNKIYMPCLETDFRYEVYYGGA